MAAKDNNVSFASVINVDDNEPSNCPDNQKEYTSTTFRTVRTLRQDTDFVRFKRKNHSFNKNALLARENRIRKKIYVQNLEQQLQMTKSKLEMLNSKLNRQNCMIVNLNQELTYYKNILLNREEICTLIKTLKYSTGLPTTSSLKYKENCSAYRVQNFDQDSNRSPVLSSPNYDFNISSPFSSFNDSDDDPILTDVSLFPNNYGIPTSPLMKRDYSDMSTEIDAHSEHNYTLKEPNLLTNVDTGVCLHISNKKMSLEFCAQCHNNFNEAWAFEENE